MLRCLIPLGNLTTHRQASLSGTRCICSLHKIRDAVRGLIAIMPSYVCLGGCNVLLQTCASFTPDSGFSSYELPWKFRLKGAKGVNTSASISANFAKHRVTVALYVCRAENEQVRALKATARKQADKLAIRKDERLNVRQELQLPVIVRNCQRRDV
ncbi:hypothetical protein G5I_06593 [Acromyrmex echinatior]|uniref:Uncharacterized protein n=1 Tax=Acromyrmex echinatior TaxID=103372 RepID=F4WLG6_ACREC|nr:hypothetical protein G5I_06593 [Acromyrmex echinatior]